MLFICQWLLFVKVMQSPHDMKCNVNFVWATHRYAQKKRVAVQQDLHLQLQS